MNNRDPLHKNVVLECHNLSKSFYEHSCQVQILRQINFSLIKKERVAIVGTSGSGKSTFLHILAGLAHASEGTVSVMDHCITGYNTHQLSQIRNRYIGFIYQFHHLLPDFTLLENMLLPLLIQGEKKNTAQPKALRMLETLGLNQQAHHKPSEASGGERQRAAVGRAIITNPPFILADEPTGNLDQDTAHAIVDTLCTLHQTSIIIVTHDNSIAKHMDRILKLENGHLIPVA